MQIDDKIIQDIKKYFQMNEIYISSEIEERFKNLSKRANEPMRLAVSGLFSSGKSTFLNAMLSDDILPSGNNPVTSKITYLRYGKEPQLKLTYNDGREEMATVDNIAKYASQQSANQIKSIDHITLYYPKNVLKKIIFVDTPGFNSPNKMDDETTENILKKVDGIMWLTMISNAGKKSEIDVLEKYFKEYSQKSICIVNHKDEIDDDDEVEEFIGELSSDKNFSKYFSKIVPISAKQALNSRKKEKKQESFKEILHFTNDVEQKLIDGIDKSDKLDQTIEELHGDIGRFLDRLRSIDKQDMSQNDQLYSESNIRQVFEYINKKILPQAKTSLSFSLKKEITSISTEISQHYQYLTGAIDDLEKRLKKFESYQKIAIEDLTSAVDRYCATVFRNIQELLAVVTDIIYHSFKLEKNGEFYPDGEETFWGGTPTGRWVDVYTFNGEYIVNQLYNENGAFSIASKKLEKSLDKMYDKLVEKVYKIEQELKKSIDEWKASYSELQEFSPENIVLHEGALESFDIFVNDFENEVIYFIKDLKMYNEFISTQYTDWNTMINTSFRVAFYFDKRESMPKKNDIRKFLQSSAISYEHTQNILTGSESIYVGLLNELRGELSKISQEKISYILPRKKAWNNKNKLLTEYMNQLFKIIE